VPVSSADQIRNLLFHLKRCATLWGASIEPWYRASRARLDRARNWVAKPAN